MVNWIEFKHVTRTLIFVCAIALLALTIFKLLSITLSLRTIAQRIGFILFSIKIILCELKIKFMLRNFPYMATEFGKALFIFFCGSLLIEDEFGAQLIIGIAMVVISIMLLIIACCIRKKGNDQYFE